MPADVPIFERASCNITRVPMNLSDHNTRLLHCRAIDQAKFRFKSQGLDQRRTGVKPARVVTEIVA